MRFMECMNRDLQVSNDISASTNNCKKDNSQDESVLYGTWVRGPNFGDTLWFKKAGGKYIMRQPESFNPLLPKYAKKEYQLKDGILSIKSFAPALQEYFQINSFKWTDYRITGVAK